VGHDDAAGRAAWLEQVIVDFIERSPENTLQPPFDEPAFDTPLVGFSKGGDPLYQDYKEHVGPFHWTPIEAFELAFPDVKVRPEELTVVSYILPQTRATKADNRKETRFPAERWARARIMGEEVNVKLRLHVVAALTEQGVQALAPVLIPQWEFKAGGPYVLASTWSERHAAYAAGLGTFGLCDAMITAKGKAMRVGSVIARIDVPPTPRPYQNHREYCLFFTQGTCKKCIPRCPVGAISEAGKDKAKCMAHLWPGTADYVKANYGFDGYGCGLCQTGVPCESKIPTARDLD